MAKLSKVAMTVKNFMELFPNSNITEFDTTPPFVVYDYSFNFKSIDYDLHFIEYFDEYSKLHHLFCRLTFNDKVIKFSKYSSLSLRYSLLNILIDLYKLDL